MPRKTPPARVHLLIHANPAGKDLARLGFVDPDEFLAFIAHQLGPAYQLTFTRELFDAVEDEQNGGRSDDAVRVADLNRALRDPRTIAVVALSGGAYLSRLLPDLDFAPLRARKSPLLLTGFSELTSLVNLVAAFPQGRGWYWLCPNYLAWKINPIEHARAVTAEFWQRLPRLLADQPFESRYLSDDPVRGQIATGAPRSGTIKVVGGCLSVLAALVGGKLLSRLPLKDRWLVIEDVNEAPYRIDRHLAALKIAGWFEKLVGVIVGDFHTREADVQNAVVELLRYHLPPKRRVPVLTTSALGHVWPMAPLPINRPLRLKVAGKRFELARF